MAKSKILFRIPEHELPEFLDIRFDGDDLTYRDPRQIFKIQGAHLKNATYVIESCGKWFVEQHHWTRQYRSAHHITFYHYPDDLRMDYQYLLDRLLSEEKMAKNLLVFKEFYCKCAGLPELFDVVKKLSTDLLVKSWI